MFKKESENAQPEILESIEKNTGSETAPTQEKVRFDGGVLLGNTDNLAFKPNEFSEVLVELIDQKKWNSLKHMVGNYPDITLKLLTEADSQLTPWAHLKIVARLFDTHFQGNGQSSWQQFVEHLESTSGTPQNLTFARSEFLRYLTTNQPTKAISLRLDKTVNAKTDVLAKAEVRRLEGIAYLMMEDYAKSVARFSEGLKLVHESHPFVASHIGLLLGEAHRHAKNHEQWKESWQAAIEIQSIWLEQRGLVDPAFWKKAAFLRPVDTPWPKPVIRRIAAALDQENLKFDIENSRNDEAVIWAIVATQSLHRHESQNAILAFKKSEALTSNFNLKNELRLQQAIAMIDGGQPGPASAILMRLGSGNDILADRSKAILATLKLQNGSLAQGMNLLQSAIKSASEWPTSERLRAQADFGLALLMRGREDQGVALLNQVHHEFLAEKNFDHASQCLWNLAKYFEKTKQPDLRETTIERMQQLESAL